MSKKTNLESSFQIVNITVVIDTEAVMKDFPTPSQDPTSPTGIAHTYAYMVATRASAISGAGTADLTIQANVGDVIRWTGISETNNFDSGVIVYGLPQFGGGTVFANPVFKSFTKSAAKPTSDLAPIPASFADQNFWFIEADIQSVGTEQYGIQFGLYYRPTGGAQQLYGYFWWDPTVTVTN